ncbi:MAG: adenosylcobalamin-dependent ribonucleoside-diphosphate reductase [Thermoplasmataceae archaeon]|jgi:ribonucleoside-diphosphate reductase alpha chain
MISTVIKRNGSEVKFDQERITTAIYKAMLAVKNGSMDDAIKVSNMVVERISKTTVKPTVEEIQDAVEDVLMTSSFNGKNYKDVARAYIIYRERRKSIREEKKRMGVEDDLKLSLNAVKVLESRYLLKDEDGHVYETPREMFSRVAKSVGIVEGFYEYRAHNKTSKGYGYQLDENQINILRRTYDEVSKESKQRFQFDELVEFVENRSVEVSGYIKKFEEEMSSLKFVPNSPTLMNAGTSMGQLSACFVLPVEDSLESIFETLKQTALIHKSGGGTGFSFSRLRQKDDIVGSTRGVASGPLSFMRIFDTTTDVIKQGGKRRGANMGILRYDHPDILEFITSKDSENTVLKNFNISVALDRNFFEKLDSGDMVDLINPRTGKVEKRVKAQTIWDAIVTQAWKTADPGLIFLDEMNERNTVPHLGEIEATNPCGEQPLMPYESCNLGSINLSKFVTNNDIDFKGLEETIRLAVRFLDDIVDANKFPVDKIKAMTRTTRKIGLGYMGFADMLAALGIPYNSKDALDVAERLMKYLNDISHDESSKLALERGNFPGWEGSYWQKQGIPMRNSTTTTIAPTGTISIIANCSSSIEPFFALAFVRHVLDGQELMETNPFLEAELRRRNIYSEDLIRKIAEKGNLSEIDLPEDLKKIFPTAMEIDPEWHVMMQATFQRYCDSGVSKTINLPADASVSDVERAYRMARDLHCKGITVYRDRSKNEQVLYAGLSSEKKEEKKRDPVPELILTAPNIVKLDSTFDPACLTGKCSA